MSEWSIRVEGGRISDVIQGHVMLTHTCHERQTDSPSQNLSLVYYEGVVTCSNDGMKNDGNSVHCTSPINLVI